VGAIVVQLRGVSASSYSLYYTRREDVEHGGYYLVTDQLAKRYPGRVIDFPPDETSLLGAAMGFSQVGLTPVVEIPYAKYLDCGSDMFYEICITNWLSAGQQPNGMVIRLQGFDRGLFGGNFHTHNMLSNIPPGVDVVCYSNGEDYVRGFRHALVQAKAGRVVVSVDSTHLLNLRHVHGKDRRWERVYPELMPNDKGGSGDASRMSFDEVIRYGTTGKSAIVTYGNGVVTALQARKSLVDKFLLKSEEELDIIDCPCLSMVPKGLKKALPQYHGVLFADICKGGPGSNVLSSMIAALQEDDLLPDKWGSVFAPRTYNPLGSVETFLNAHDIEAAWQKLHKRIE
jgi:pyruvate/2-oxoglutarate/acetoin dehydrogenase E1 component